MVLAMIAAYGVLLGFRGAESVDALSGDIRTLGIVALAAFILSALAVIVIGRTITDPLDELSGAATELANVRLPLLVESLRTPGMATPEFAPLEIEEGGNDEMRKLVTALNSVQDSASQVATEQQNLVRQGLSDLVVNLARRNQSLLDRQIESIDRLESNEEDPDRLEELFGLDHLATRMRRNAESLLVLAGAEPSRRRGGPVAVADILRVAMSEIEDYRHVHLMQIDEGEIGAQAAVDLAHLLSEVMENATQFSPPESPVEVNGMTQPDGCYLITVADHGLGMTDDQIRASNETLANPPELGLGLSRSLGFIVIGRLGQRLEVQVELAYTEGGGITALVLVPSTIITVGQPAEGMPAAMDAAPDAALAAPGAEAASTHVAPAAPEALGGAPIPAALGGAPSSAPADIPAGLGGPVADAPIQDTPIQDAPDQSIPAALGGSVPAALGGSPTNDPFAAPTDAPADPFAAPAEESWTPPVMPERGTPILDGDARTSELPSFDSAEQFDAAPSFDDAPSFEDTPSFDAAPSFDAQSFDAQSFDAAPSFDPAEQFDAAPSFDAPADPFAAPSGAPADPFAASGAGSEETWTAPAFPAPSSAPDNLEQAIPSGDQFDTGMASLLETGTPAPAGATGSGLVKRNRSESQAPTSDGGRPIKASARSPEEIRQMVARYRDGRGRPTSGAADPSSSYESGEQA